MNESNDYIDNIDNLPDGESITVIAHVDEIWDNDINWISQKGVISDRTGKTCFRVFSHSNLPKFELNKTYKITNAIAHIWDGWSSIDLDEHTEIYQLNPVYVYRSDMNENNSIDSIILSIDLNKKFYYIISGYAKQVTINNDQKKAYSDNIFLIIKPNGYIAVTRTTEHGYKSIMDMDHFNFFKINDGYYFIVNSKDGDSILILFDRIHEVQFRVEKDFPVINNNISRGEYFSKIKKLYPNAKNRWTDDEVKDLINMYKSKFDFFSMADNFLKEPSAVITKLVLLSLNKKITLNGFDNSNKGIEYGHEEVIKHTYKRDIVILANSIKYSGRCIAGKDIKTAEWVRVVPNNEEKAFPSTELLHISKDRNGPKLLDIMTIPFSKKTPLNYHPEDEFIKQDILWIKKGILNKKNGIDNLVDSEDWVTRTSQSFHLSDRIPSSYFKNLKMKNSLQFIKLDAHENRPILKYQHKPVKDYFRPRLSFNYKNYEYDLAITDPNCRIMNVDPGPQALGNCYITVGLSEVYEDNYHYKLIVGIILED